MNIWYTSLNGAMVLSVIAMLSFIGYTLLEFRYFFGIVDCRRESRDPRDVICACSG